jgi:hypothetical protein
MFKLTWRWNNESESDIFRLFPVEQKARDHWKTLEEAGAVLVSLRDMDKGVELNDVG